MVTADAQQISRTIARNSVVVSAGNWASKLLYLAFNVVVVRWLGEVGLGQYATVLAFVGIFGILFNFGMSQHMERSIARDPSQAASLFWNLIALRCLLALFGVVTITGLAAAAGYDRVLIVGVFAYSLTYILAAGQMPLTGVLKAHERFDIVTGATLLGRVVSMGVGLILLWAGAGYLALVLTGFVAIPMQIGCSIWAIRRQGIDLTRRHIMPRSWPIMIRTGVPFGVLALGLSFNASVITVVLGMTSDSGAVGWYNAAYRLVVHCVGITGGFLVVMLPSLTRIYQRDPSQVARWTSTTFHWVVLVVLPASAGISLLAPRIVWLLYGASYTPAGPVLRLIAWDIPLMLSVAFFANVCAAVGQERSAARIYLGGIALNVGVAVAIVPSFGMTGAAIVNVIVDSIVASTFAFMIYRKVHVEFNALRLSQIAISTAVMSAIVWMSRSLPLALVAFIGAATYVACAFAFGLLTWGMLINVVQRRARLSAANT